MEDRLIAGNLTDFPRREIVNKQVRGNNIQRAIYRKSIELELDTVAVFERSVVSGFDAAGFVVEDKYLSTAVPPLFADEIDDTSDKDIIMDKGKRLFTANVK